MPSHNTALHWRDLTAASAAGDLNRVKQLLSAGVEINKSALFAAIEIVRLVTSGSTSKTWQPRSISSMVSIVRCLLRAGADPNAINRWGDRALGAAVQAGDKRVVNALIKAGAKLDAVSGGRTPLILAICNNRPDMVKQLLKAGASVDARDIYKCTALMEAAYRSEEKMVLLLLRSGANPRLRWEHGTALSSAEKAGKTGNVLILQQALRDA